MRKIYLVAAAFLLTGTLANAQNNVTFKVDMNAETVSANGVHVAGDFQNEAGAPNDWDPAATPLSDGDADGIYEVTVVIPSGYYQFKFINDNGWGGVESVPAVCQVEEGQGNDNRWVLVNGDMEVATTFNGSAPSGMNFVKFKLDMENEGAGKVPSMSGSFVGSGGWDEAGVAMHNYDGTKWTNYVYLADGDYEYKYRDTNNWSGKNESVDGDCIVGGGNSNRTLKVEGDMILDLVCFNSCDPCSAPPEKNPIKVTLQVDLSNTKVCESFDKITVAGGFNGWPGDGTGAELKDDDNDDIYTITLDWETNNKYEYKFQLITGTTAKWEGIGNRVFNTNTKSTDTTIAVVCFDSEEACGPTPPAADSITFRVDMSKESSPADTIWVIGSFTDPQWQAGAIALDYSGVGGIFETTVEICAESFKFKYTNGDPNNQAFEEFVGADSAQAHCAEPNGLGGYNREYTRTGGEEVIPTYYFSSCDINTASVEPKEEIGFSIFPNPTNGNIQITLNNDERVGITLTDLSGKLVKDFGMQNGIQFNLNANEIESGLYLINIQSATGTGVAKLIVE
ncbi:MAG: T9SS type A sorting domain-containing protein [Bacteroidetes bacterium]|nr:T9SS type A sorting domain-containing protein [Bacteroidota bacterium]